MRRPAIPTLALSLLAALAPRIAEAQQPPHHHHHEPPKKPQERPAAAKPATTTTTVSAGDVARAPVRVQRVQQNGVVVEFSVTPTIATGGQAVESEDAVVRLRLADTTGRPLAGLAPAAWIDRRAGTALTAPAACRMKVDKYVQASTNMEQALKARAVVDLNSYFVLALNRGPNISVIDPFLGFGRTKLYTTVRLKGEGHDWKLSGDQDRLYVTMPGVAQVAIVNTDNWKVVTNIDAGPWPARIALQPDERYVWVTNSGADSAAKGRDSVLARGGVTVIDRAAMKRIAQIPTGIGPHALAFSADNRYAFVLNQRSGTLSVIDIERLAKVKDVKLGPRPVDLAYAPVANAVYAIDEQDGGVTVVDARTHEVVKRLQLEPGVRTIRFAPTTGSGHGAHGAHAAHAPGGGAAAAGRLGFVLNPRRNTVAIIDATGNTILRTTEMGNQPDQVAFTTSFAYIRSAGSPEVAMIPLADPSAGGVGHLDKFPAGGAAPRLAGQLSEADAMVAAPDMPDAVYVMNPKERMIYYFHYMEGMPIPSGGLTTYGFEPKAVLVAGKDLRETGPGVYEATIKLTDRGDYDFIFLLDDPRVINCFELPVGANPRLHKGRSAVTITPVMARRELRVGENVLKFRIADLYTREALSDRTDVNVLVVSTTGWRQRATAKPVGDGAYEVSLTVPGTGVYYVSFEIPSLDVKLNDRSPVILRAR